MASNKSLIDRMVRAAKLDVNLYEEVEADTSANMQAFLVVIIVSLATGIGGAISALLYNYEDNGVSSILWGLIGGVGFSLLGWLIWSLVVYGVGVMLFKTKETEADYGQLLRTLGFANTPNILGFLIFIPLLGALLALVGFVWMLIAGIIAVRQALDFSTWRAVGTCIVGLIPYLLLMSLLSWVIL